MKTIRALFFATLLVGYIGITAVILLIGFPIFFVLSAIAIIEIAFLHRRPFIMKIVNPWGKVLELLVKLGGFEEKIINFLETLKPNK